MAYLCRGISLCLIGLTLLASATEPAKDPAAHGRRTSLDWEPNETCASSIAIWSLPFSYSGNTANALNDRSNCVGASSPDVFFTLATLGCQQVTVSLCGSSYDTGLEVRTGGDCPGATQIACNDDYSGCGLQSQVSFWIGGGTQWVYYYIIVHGYGMNSGPYTINATAGSPPYYANDHCPGIAISSLPYTDNNSTECRINDFMNCVTSSSADAVYTYTATSCLQITVSLCGSSYDTALEIREGGACPGATQVACNDDVCGLQSQISFWTTPNTTYYFIVAGYGTAVGSYQLNVSVTGFVNLTNDQCPGTAVTLPFSETGSTVCALHDYTNCVGSNAPDLIYSFTVPVCELVNISTCESPTQYNTALEVRGGGACPGSVQLACNDDACGYSGQQSFLQILAQPAVIYYVILSGNGVPPSDRGAFRLDITGTPFPPPNDQCPGTTISYLPYTDSHNTSCATNNYSNCVFPSSNDVFYVLQSSALCRTITASLCGSMYNTALEVRTGGNCPGTTQVACNDDNYCGQTWTAHSTTTFTALASQTYYMIVSGANQNGGPYTFNVDGTEIPAPVADQCPGIHIGALPFEDTGNTLCAIANFANCVTSTSRDVVYSYTSLGCEQITVSLCGSGFDTGLEVRYGGACLGNTQLLCNDDYCGTSSQITFDALPDTIVYYFIISGYQNQAGAYSIDVTSIPQAPPSGDVCPGIPITNIYYLGPTFSDTVYTHCAGADYPNCAGVGTRDVVHTLNVWQCNILSVSAGGWDAQDNADLEVRAGESCPGTTQIGCNYSLYGQGGIGAVEFIAEPGINYYLISHIRGAGARIITSVGLGLGWPYTDDCAYYGAVGVPDTVMGSTRGLDHDYHTCHDALGHDALYRLAPQTTCTDVTVTVCWACFDPLIEVRTDDGGCPSDVAIACNDDSLCNGQPSTGSMVTFTADPNEVYWIIVTSSDHYTDEGPFTMTTSSMPHVLPADRCPGLAIAILPFADSSFIQCANNDLVNCVRADGKDVLYRYTSPICQTITANTCGSLFNTALQVRQGTVCPGNLPLDCNNDYCGLQSQLSFNAMAGQTYFFVVSQADTTSGKYFLNVTGIPLTPPNDHCPGTAITSLPFDDIGITSCAVNDYAITCRPTSTAPDQVYLLVLPSCQVVTASLCGSAFNTVLEVRTGGSCPGTTLVQCNDDFCSQQSQITWMVNASQTYYLIVDGYDASSAGDFTLTITGQTCAPPPPVNTLVIKYVTGTADNKLHWNRVPDADRYYVYRDSTLNVPLDLLHRIADVADTFYVDSGITGSQGKSFYVVTSVAMP
jgi:hypothetical protein